MFYRQIMSVMGRDPPTSYAADDRGGTIADRSPQCDGSAHLDDIDLRLIRELQADGRTPFEVLAGAVGLSRPAVSARVGRMVRADIIDIVGIVHPRTRGLTASAHLFLQVDGDAEVVARAVAEMPEAPFVTVTTGRHPVMAEIRVAGWDSLETPIGNIRALDGVTQVDVLTGVRRLKDPYLPVADVTLPEPDEADRRILARLEVDGRAPFADLAAAAGLSPAATRTRTRRMVEAGVVRIPALVRPQALGLDILCGFAVHIRTGRHDIEDALADDPRVAFLSACLGGADLVGTLTTDSFVALRSTLDSIRSLPGVQAVESWMHIDVVKERYDSGPQHSAQD